MIIILILLVIVYDMVGKAVKPSEGHGCAYDFCTQETVGMPSEAMAGA